MKSKSHIEPIREEFNDWFEEQSKKRVITHRICATWWIDKIKKHDEEMREKVIKICEEYEDDEANEIISKIRKL